jgi:glutamyl/glutaminyl-tRNA synthetase
MITRIAPTPSGFIHVGNCANFLLIDWFAAQHGARVALRIDDMDADRYRPEYVRDVFRVLEWLEIPWHAGPRDPSEFESSFSLRSRTEYYFQELVDGTDAGLATYACACSRAELASAGAKSCVKGCRERGVALRPGHSLLRVDIPPGTVVNVGGLDVNLADSVGDFVVWRRDGMPSYHLASVVEDRDLGTTHIVRGRDLLDSTAAQIFLAAQLRMPTVVRARYLHHELITDADGHKLSKSQLSTGPLATTDENLQAVREAATRLAPTIGVNPR